MNNTISQNQEGPGLKRVLKLYHLVFIGVAYLSPAVILMYYGILAHISGGHFVIVIAITTVAMLFTATSYAKMTRKYPISGSVYTYIQKTIHPNPGFLVGWALLLDYLLLPMICHLAFALYLNVLFPAVPFWLWVVVSVSIVTVLNLRGVTLAAMVDTAISAFGILTVVVTIILSAVYIYNGGGTGTLATTLILYNPETFNMGGILAAAAVLCVAFVGYDAISTLAEEAIHPEKNVGRAIVLVCLGAGIIFLITGVFMTATWPTIANDVVNPDTAVTEYYILIGVPLMNSIFVVLNSVACIAISLSGQLAVSRILYSMGRDGFLPKKVFAYINPKTNIPSYNILITSGIGLIAIAFAGQLMEAISLVSFGALIGFFFVNVSVIMQYLVKEKASGIYAKLNYGVVPVIGALIILYLFINLEGNAKIIGTIWIVVGFVFLLIKTRGLRQLPPEMKL